MTEHSSKDEPSGDSLPPPDSRSVIDWLEERTGERAKVSLRSSQNDSPTPLLKPIGNDDAQDAGKYVVHGELGRGGVGSVHRGHDRDLGRDVALKFLHDRYHDNDSVLHRFVEEAQIGGQLQHPGIVPVYDLGMTDGKPFFAMKLIKGQTLAKKLTEQESPASGLGTFLGVFEDVCQTMAYAHARGVVHRDLKPANIMIGGFGEVQVVDWGMGKVLQQGGVADEQRAAEKHEMESVVETLRSAGHGTQSVMGSVLGTPAYMPPEQARGDVGAMDERSDVFALGAILCEILTGQPPYTGTPEEMLVLAVGARLDDAVARLRSSGAEQPLIELAEQCLSPAPEARPASAQVVARRIHEHRAAAETRAREATLEAAEARGRAASLKRAQTLGVALTVAIAAGLFASIWLWQDAEESGSRARQAAETAERELARAVEMKSLLKDMLAAVDPEVSVGVDTTLMEIILEATADRLKAGEVADELVAAELRTLIGRVESSLGRDARAVEQLESALEIRRRRLGSDAEQTLGTAKSLAAAYIGLSRWADSERLGRDTLTRMKRVLGPQHRETLGTMSNLATVVSELGQKDEAEAMLREMLAIARPVLGESDSYTLITMGTLAAELQAGGRFDEADTILRDALRLSVAAKGERDPITLNLRMHEGRLRFSEGKFAEAAFIFRESLPVLREVLGSDHPSTLTMLTLAGVANSRLGRHKLAESLGREAYDTRLRERGPGHAMTRSSATALARTLVRAGKTEAAIAQYDQLIGWCRDSLGKGHPATIRVLTEASDLWTESKQLERAVGWLEDAFRLRRESSGVSDPSTLTAAENLASACMALQRFERAYELYGILHEVRERTLPEDHRFRLGTMTNLGMTAFAIGKLEESRTWLERSLARKREVLGLGDPWTRNALLALARTYDALGKRDEELGLWREQMEFDLRPAASPTATINQLDEAARLLLTIEFRKLRDPARAVVYAKRACENAAQNERWQYQFTLAMAQFRAGDIEDAVATQRAAVNAIPATTREEIARSMRKRLESFEAELSRRR